MVNKAMKGGYLKRLPCEVCGKEITQAHHEDYSKPLDVNWLCVRHHNDRHIYIGDQTILKKPILKIEKWIKKIT
jgi:hypothetical protein